nr:HAD-IIIC family phosphatase [uncultured Helicobacter sp.]
MFFSYPLDSTLLLRKKKSLKKNLLDNLQTNTESTLHKNIAILGGSSTQEVCDMLELFLLDCGIVPHFYQSEYNKFYEDSVFENKALRDFKPDIIYIHTSFVNVRFDESEWTTFTQVWQSLSDTYQCAIIQNNFELPPYRIYGNLDSILPSAKTQYIHTLNAKIHAKIYETPNLYIHDICYLSASLGLEKWYDFSLYARTKYALSLECIPHLAWNLSHIIKAIFGINKKALVLDLDNTLWGGVIGDDGLSGIHIGTETPLAESYTLFQRYIKELKDRGIMLSVCSKNEYENAKNGFTHPSSILRFDDFMSFQANWNLKSENIKVIAKELNIGLNTLVFIDDNPTERHLVSQSLPSVAVPESHNQQIDRDSQAVPQMLGVDVLDFIPHIDKNGYFESISISQEDLERNSYYTQNKARDEALSAFTNYNEFLQSLAMKAQIIPFSPLFMERIAQLTNKTNQFNLTTKRYTQATLESIAKDSSFITLQGRLKDRFGDNGLIALLIARIEDKTAHIDLWLMSCRVLKRTMEYAMLDTLIKHAKTKGVKTLIGYYYKTQKNAMVADLYSDFGFSLKAQNGDDSIWQLDIDKYKPKDYFIGVNDD